MKEKRPFGKRQTGEAVRVERTTIGKGSKKPFGKKKEFGERKSYAPKGEGRFAARDEAPRKPRASAPRRDRDEDFADKPAFGKKPYGERKSFGEKKEFGERKSFGDKKPYGERKSFGDRKPYGDKKEYGERKSFGDKKPFTKRFDRDSRPPRREEPALHADPNGVLLWGTHAVREALLNKKRKCRTLWVTDSGRAAIAETLEAARQAGIERPDPVRVEKEDLERLLPRNSVHQGLVLDAQPLAEMTLDDLLGLDEGPEIVVILDQVTDPHNVGAIMRSAAAFGANAVIVTERNAPGTTGILAKTACGACEHIPLIPVVNLARALEALKAESFWVIGLAEEGDKDLSASALSSGRIALVMGAEGEGLRRLTREHCDELARLPTGGAIGSLNVSNAAAVSLYEARRQRNAR